MPDWMPDDEAAYDALLTTYGDYLNGHAAALGVTEAKKAAFLSLIGAYSNSLSR